MKPKINIDKAEEIVLSYLERIEEIEEKISAFITLLGEGALDRAETIDRKKERGRLAGIPAISIPVSLSQQKLPLGLQIMGNFFQESQLFKLAFLLEKKVKFRKSK